MIYSKEIIIGAAEVSLQFIAPFPESSTGSWSFLLAEFSFQPKWLVKRIVSLFLTQTFYKNYINRLQFYLLSPLCLVSPVFNVSPVPLSVRGVPCSSKVFPVSPVPLCGPVTLCYPVFPCVTLCYPVLINNYSSSPNVLLTQRP